MRPVLSTVAEREDSAWEDGGGCTNASPSLEIEEIHAGSRCGTLTGSGGASMDSNDSRYVS